MPALTIAALRATLLAAALLAQAASAPAAQGLGSAPVHAQLRADATALAVGRTFSVSVRLAALADIPQAQLTLRTGGCAELLPGQMGQTGFALKSGASMQWRFRWRLLDEQPCHVMAEVTLPQTDGTRLSSAYAVTINARREPLPEGTTHGRTAEGRKTIEAPSAPR